MTATSLRSARRVTYDAGSEFAPDDPFGRTVLTIDRSGRATLGNWFRGSTRAWIGTVEVAALHAVLAHLEAGGFPDARPRSIPPGARFTVTVTAPDAGARSVTDSLYPDNEGYKNALSWLNAIVRQLSGDAIPVGRAVRDVLVHESRTAAIAEVSATP